MGFLAEAVNGEGEVQTEGCAAGSGISGTSQPPAHAMMKRWYNDEDRSTGWFKTEDVDRAVVTQPPWRRPDDSLIISAYLHNAPSTAPPIVKNVGILSFPSAKFHEPIFISLSSNEAQNAAKKSVVQCATGHPCHCLFPLSSPPLQQLDFGAACSP